MSSDWSGQLVLVPPISLPYLEELYPRVLKPRVSGGPYLTSSADSGTFDWTRERGRCSLWSGGIHISNFSSSVRGFRPANAI
jgi:hypothetical protein